jgi:hypothetical protein
MKTQLQAALLSACALATTTAGATTVTTPNAAHSAIMQFPTYDGKAEQVRFTLKGEEGGLRTFEQSSSARMREAVASTVSYGDVAGLPKVRSGNLAFDALFAQAVTEMRQNSVAAIRDGAYNDGKPIPCECFETGEKWNYVWTRDLSYAADLGLALLDPVRVRNSLEFKLSGYRPGIVRAPGVAGSDDGLQVIQDTGSGGSWPVSTDRVTWAFGAEQTLHALPAAERTAFSVTAYRALSNTIENDRLAAFDPRDGLYTGEQSFLDWREQTYGAGIADDLARMASAKALSTNVAHYKALTVAAGLAAQLGHEDAATRYRGWARELKLAINQRFWLEDAGLYSSLTGPHFDGAALHKFDWLGQSLAVITGVAEGQRAARILSSYPHGPMGAPVIYPQQPDVPIYHNRAIWPFVTAYGLEAAARTHNVAVADAAYATLMRGASVHLSNMENFEWLSGQALFEDPDHPHLNGPVINSRRQLWSVGAYLGMVIRNVFGVRAEADGISIQPFITARLRRETLAGADHIALEDLHINGRTLRVRIALPAASKEEGYYTVRALTVNGKSAPATLRLADLAEHNTIEISLGALAAGDQRITHVQDTPLRHRGGSTFAPSEPAIAAVVRKGTALEVDIADTANPAGQVAYRLYRNGQLLAEGLKAGVFADRAPLARLNCYAVEAVDTGTGLRSHHSAPVCAEHGIEIGMDDARVKTSVPLTRDPQPVIRGWGAPADTLSVAQVGLGASGRYAIQLRYKNTGHAINTGVSNGVKLLTVRDDAGQPVARRVIQLPHLPPASAPLLSTPADVTLVAGTYTIELSDFYNMSYLSSNALYGAGGGKSGPLNKIDLYGVRILPLE